MDIDRLRRGLNTRLLGRTIVFFAQTNSTNVVAKEMAERGAPDGTVVIADYQSAGHGRRGRAWLADPGDSLLMSAIVRPGIPPAEVFYLTMVPALAVLATITTLGVRGASLKWPNDVQINARKVAGILTELSLRGRDLDYVVIGIGLNVNLDVARHPEIAALATSLSGELGRPLDREDVARLLLQTLEDRYLALERGEAAAILSDWRDSLSTLGQWVDVDDGGSSYHAFAEDVTADGGLVLRRDGRRLVVYGGDVTLAKPR